MLKSWLQKNRNTLVTDWTEKTFDVYSSDAASFFRQQKDPFSNPIGQTVEQGMKELFDGFLADEANAQELCGALERIIKIRAIQEFSPAKAIVFVFLLKDLVRERIGKEKGIQQEAMLPDLLAFERRVDQLALYAFDIYVRCREKIADLRVDEIKRNVSTLIKRSSWMEPPFAQYGSEKGEKNNSETH